MTSVVVSPVPRRWHDFLSKGILTGGPWSYIRFSTVDGRDDEIIPWVFDPAEVLWALDGFEWPVEQRHTPEALERRRDPIS